MAEDKKGFLLYCDIINSIEHLTNEEKGILFQHLLEYVNDLNPILEDRVLIGVWKHIENQLKRDLKKYEAKVSKSSLAGREGNLKRWNLDLYEEYKKGVYTLLGAESIASGRKGSLPDKPESGGVAKIADKDNVTVTVNDTVIDKDINKSKSSIDEEFVFFWNTYDKKKDNKKCKIKWKNLSKSDKEIILNTVKEYVKANPDKKYRKNPLSYLNGECWNDEISKTQQKGNLPTDNIVF